MSVKLFNCFIIFVELSNVNNAPILKFSYDIVKDNSCYFCSSSKCVPKMNNINLH